MDAPADDPMEFEEEDQTPVVAEGEDYATDLLSGTGSSPTANIIASAGMNLLPDKNLSFLSDELNKRQRCNAKAVEWLSMEGEHLGQFRSVSSPLHPVDSSSSSFSSMYSKCCAWVSLPTGV